MDDNNRTVFLVTFPLIDSPGQTYSVMLDRGRDYDSYNEWTEDQAKHEVIAEIECCDAEEAEDYPKDLNMDPADVTCRKMTYAEAEEASKSSTNTSWWG